MVSYTLTSEFGIHYITSVWTLARAPYMHSGQSLVSVQRNATDACDARKLRKKRNRRS